MRKQKSVFILITLLIIAMTLPTVNAYTGAVTVTGVVRDAQGRGVSGASVSIISGKTKLYTTTSVSGGSFAFNSKSLSDGTYTIQASKSNYLAGTSSEYRLENADRIFEPYFNPAPDDVVSEVPVVKRIMESHQGFVDVTPNDSNGYTFTLTFPWKRRRYIRVYPLNNAD